MPTYYQRFVRDRIISKYIYNWSAFSSNKASCKIAEKLGGIVVEGKKFDNGGYVCSGGEYRFSGWRGNSQNGNI